MHRVQLVERVVRKKKLSWGVGKRDCQAAKHPAVQKKVVGMFRGARVRSTDKDPLPRMGHAMQHHWGERKDVQGEKRKGENQIKLGSKSGVE